MNSLFGILNPSHYLVFAIVKGVISFVV